MHVKPEELLPGDAVTWTAVYGHVVFPSGRIGHLLFSKSDSITVMRCSAEERGQ